MRIILFPDWYPDRYRPLNGIFIRRHARAVSLFHEIGVVKVYGDQHLQSSYSVEVLQENGFPEIYAVFKKSNFPILGKLQNLFRFWKAWQLGVAEYEKRIGQPELSHGYVLPRGGLQAWWLSKKKNIPLVLSDQWTGYQTNDWAEQSWSRRFLTRFCLKKANAAIVVSSAIKNAMQKLAPQLPFHVLPNICVPVRREGKFRLPKKGNEKLLFTVGIWDYWKNVSGLLRALKMVLEKRQDVHLHLVGDHESQPAQEQLAKELGIEKHVTYHGSLPNPQVMDYMASCDLYITNSNAESFSVATIEAMAVGKPVVATACGGPEDFVTPETGLLIPIKEDKILADSILKMLDHLDKYDPSVLMDYASNNFSEEAVGRKFDEIYRLVKSGERREERGE